MREDELKAIRDLAESVQLIAGFLMSSGYDNPGQILGKKMYELSEPAKTLRLKEEQK